MSSSPLRTWQILFSRDLFSMGGSRALNSSKIHHGAALCTRIVSALSVLRGSGFQSPVKADMFVQIEWRLATTCHCVENDGWGRGVRRRRNSSTALAREAVDVLIFVSVVDLLLSALRFDINRRGLLQVQDVTDHNQIGQQQDSDENVPHAESVARKR
jgi:hypothetical protein